MAMAAIKALDVPLAQRMLATAEDLGAGDKVSKWTRNRITELAKAGIDWASGARNKQARNNTATVIAVSPVRPPAETPAPLSM